MLSSLAKSSIGVVAARNACPSNLAVAARHSLAHPTTLILRRSFIASTQGAFNTTRTKGNQNIVLAQLPSTCWLTAARDFLPTRHSWRSHQALTAFRPGCCRPFSVTRRASQTDKDQSNTSDSPTEPYSQTSHDSSSKPAKTAGAAAGKAAHGSSVKDRLLLDRLPDLSQFHRPTKEELLAAATGFWSRLRIRFKWFSIRSARPFNLDDLSAFFTWIVAGHVLWIIMGTTTFFSLLIFAVNTVFAQETLASAVGNYLTKSSGVKVVFESAIVPKWKNGVITFRNVFVSRRPGETKSAVRKGSQTTAQAAAAAAALAEKAEGGEEEEDTNYTQFDVSIETINVTLSFAKWWNGKGLLRDVEMKGVRGVVDRTSVHWGDGYVDPRIYKHEHVPGDFELESFKLDDLLVSVYQPGNFRPFSVSIFSADLPQLRKQWLFYDFLSANHLSGSFDESPIFIHPRQTHNFLGTNSPQEDESGHWKKYSRIRIDGLNVDHLNRGVEGPFSWIREGNVDIIADVMIPAETDESMTKLMVDFYDRMEATVSSNKYVRFPINNDSRQTLLPAPKPLENKVADLKEASGQPTRDSQDHRFLIMDLRVHLNDVQAAVPLFTSDLSYMSNALIRPIVAYINSHKSFIPINCRVVKRASEFDGSWTIYDSGLMEDLSRETYDAFARDVVDEQARRRRIKKVGLWSLQLAIQALLVGFAGGVA